MHHQRRRTPRRLSTVLLALALALAGCGSDDGDKPSDQQTNYVVGVVNLTPVLDPVLDGFKSGLAELGYNNANLTYIYNGPTGDIGALAAEAQLMVDADVDLILCLSTPAAAAVKAATADNQIPAVFAPIQDPVAAGLVASVSEPGGNLTGVMFGMQEGPRFEWLLKLAPDVTRVFVPHNPDDPAPTAALAIVKEAAAALDVELVLADVRNGAEAADAVAAMPDDVDAIYLLPDSLVAAQAAQFIAVADARQIPLGVTPSGLVQQGGLYSYGFEAGPTGAQAARLAHEILKGAHPSALPVEVAEFYLAVNLRTADTIGLTVSDSILRQAYLVVRE